MALFALVLLRDARDAAARVANFGTWMQVVREVIRETGGGDALKTFFAYLDTVIGSENFKEFGGKMYLAVPETEPIMRTYADELREEGLERGLEQGLEQGLERGQNMRLRMVVVDVLELRGFALTQAQRERIAACDSLETLERWYAAAKTAQVGRPVDQVLDEGDVGSSAG